MNNVFRDINIYYIERGRERARERDREKKHCTSLTFLKPMTNVNVSIFPKSIVTCLLCSQPLSENEGKFVYLKQRISEFYFSVAF